MKVRFARLHEIVEDIALLKPKTDHDGHHPLDETAAPLAVCAENFLCARGLAARRCSLGEVVGSARLLPPRRRSTARRYSFRISSHMPATFGHGSSPPA